LNSVEEIDADEIVLLYNMLSEIQGERHQVSEELQTLQFLLAIRHWAAGYRRLHRMAGKDDALLELQRELASNSEKTGRMMYYGHNT
jgi:hypothetical protein